MGQYQQWMHYREVDRMLRERLEQIEDELASLLQSSPELAQLTCLSNNPIILALAAHLHDGSSHNLVTETVPPSSQDKALTTSQQAAAPAIAEIPADEEQITTARAISPALRSWSEFPDSDDIAASALSVSFPDQVSSATPQDNFNLLPDDMNVLFEQHSLTDPQIELPWWLQNIATTAGMNQPNGLIDPQSVRTNRLVQRWLERWGRQSPTSQKQGE